MTRILAVDDEPFMLQVLERGLRRAGYQIDVACNGREAVDRVEHGGYQIVITDMEMPVMDGRGLCEAMQAMPHGPPSLTLVLTGKTDPELRDWAASLPRTELLEKPMSLSRLLARLQQHVAECAAGLAP